jgi:minor extracellular serine protease Vpr
MEIFVIIIAHMITKGVAMFKKLVMVTLVILLTLPVTAPLYALVNDRLNEVIIIFNGGMTFEYSDRMLVRNVAALNRTHLDFLSNKICGVDSRIKITNTYEVVSFGVGANIPDSSIPLIRSMPFVKEVLTPQILEPAAVLSNADLVNTGSIYSLTDEKGQLITGKGITVGVIDSGIDYRHPDLGGGKYGDLGKVIGGVNYISKNETPIDDDNIGHGTAIAGIIACDSKTRYPGVAPNALLKSYKVYSNTKKTVTESTVLAALDQAVTDGCQVVNISLSSPGTGKQSALAKGAETATNAGVIVVGAAGDYGSFHSASNSGTVGGAGVAEKSICVGSSDVRYGFRFDIVGANRTFTGMASLPMIDFGEQTLEIVDGGYGTLDEISNLTLRNKYILIKRGPEIGDSISYMQKVSNAKRRGANGVIIWNSIPGELIQMDLGFNKETGEQLTEKDLIPSCFINYSDGFVLQSLISKGSIQIKPSLIKIFGIAKFSAMGPTEGLVFKPDFCAPGVGLNAPMSMNPANPTIPKYSNTFAGTSASAALVSGAVSLMKQLKPGWTSNDIRLALMNTATVIENRNSRQPTSFQMQGSGTIDVTAAVATPAVISPGGLIFTGSNKELTLTIKGLEQASFNITTAVFDGMEDKIKLSVSSTSKTVSKGKEDKLIVNAEFEPDSLPYNMQGMIYLESVNAKLHIPVIFWKEFAGSGQRPVKSASFVNRSYDYTKPDNTVNFDFAIGFGDKFESQSLGYKLSTSTKEDEETSKYNSLTSLSIDLVDGNGDTWVTIKRFENLEAGYYRFNWSGYDAEGINKVPNGSYGIKLVQTETETVKGSTRKNVVYNSLPLKGVITVSGSDIPKPPQLFMSVRPFTPSENQKFIIDVYVTNAKDVGSISGEIIYPGDEVNMLDVKSGNFLGNDGASFESDILIEGKGDESGKSVGKVLFRQKRSSDTGIDGWGIIATMIASCPKSGNPEITFRNQSLYDSKGNWIMHMANPLILEITTEEPLTGDLNFDGIVDMVDLFIFSQSYGLTRNDRNFNMLADFNNDGIVDGKDYDILRKNLGKRN